MWPVCGTLGCYYTDENVYSKLLDRYSRARNAILFNVTETSASIPVNLMIISIARDVLNAVGATVNLVSIHRLGKASSEPCTIRVTISSSTDVFEILKVKRT